MQLTLISPTSSETIAIDWLEVYTSGGSFIIQQGHAPLIAVLAQKQEITMGFADGTFRLQRLESGIVQVDRNQVTIVITHE